jgi:hypothetical protein
MQKDGNPIFDGYSQALGRAFRIIQQPPESDGVEITAWIKTYDLEGETTLLPESELVLNLSLSDESAEVAQALLQSWMKWDITPSAMKAVIDASLLGHRDNET